MNCVHLLALIWWCLIGYSIFSILYIFYILLPLEQVFFTVVLFGLFHGLVYLPVVLSWLGPEPYHTSSVHMSPRRQIEMDKASNGHVEGSKLLDQVSVRSKQSTVISCYVNAFLTISIRTKIVA